MKEEMFSSFVLINMCLADIIRGIEHVLINIL